MAYTYQQLLDDPNIYRSAHEFLELFCDHCGQVFRREKRNVCKSLIENRKNIFCSQACFYASVDRRVTIQCSTCGKDVVRAQAERSGSGRQFCSQSCAATYNNLHKTHGTRRSKLEVWLETQLRTRYPSLEVLFNAKEAINAELDIHFPSLNLAFELNGIYHYEPIHGAGKLASIQSNDHRKFAACAEKGISLCVIDVSTLEYFKPAKGQKFLDIITDIIDEKLLIPPAGIEPA